MANAVPRLRQARKEERAADRMDKERIPERHCDEAGGSITMVDFESDEEQPQKKAYHQAKGSEDEEEDTDNGTEEGQDSSNEAAATDDPNEDEEECIAHVSSTCDPVCIFC